MQRIRADVSPSEPSGPTAESATNSSSPVGSGEGFSMNNGIRRVPPADTVGKGA